MFNDRRSLFRFSAVVVILGVSGGLLSNFYYSKGNTRGGFVSPVVFGKAVQGKEKVGFSPFALLFKNKNNEADKTSPVSPSTTLSFSGGGETNPKAGNVLGESTASVNDAPSVNGTNQTTATSGSSNTTTSSSSSSSSSGSFNSGGNSSSTLGNRPVTLTATQQAVEDVTNVVTGYLKSANYPALYNLMSTDFKNTFSPEDFVSSFSGSGVISSTSIILSPKIYGASSEWAEEGVKLNLSDGSSQSYLNIYHLENSAWTLFATQDQ